MSITLRQILFHDDLVSKPNKDNFQDLENFVNNLEDQIGLLTTTPGGTEVTNARDYHAVLRDRLRSGFNGVRNQLITGGVVTQQGSPNMTVAISAGEALIFGVGVSFSGQNSGTITAPTNFRYDVVVINSDNTISIASGNDSADPVLPNISSTQIPVAIIRLTSSTTSITTSIIENISNQGCTYFKGNIQKYAWKIQDAVNDVGTGDIFIGAGSYYEEVNLASVSNVGLIYQQGAKHYRYSDSTYCVKSINTPGNENSFLKIIGGQFYGNGKTGSNELIHFEYSDDMIIKDPYFDTNSLSSANTKQFYFLACDRARVNGINVFVSEALINAVLWATDAVLIPDHEISDVYNLFTIASGEFRAPFTGLYHFRYATLQSVNGGVYLSVNGSAHDSTYYSDSLFIKDNVASGQNINSSLTIQLETGDIVTFNADTATTEVPTKGVMQIYKVAQ